MTNYYNEGRAKAVKNAGGVLYNLAIGDANSGRRPNVSALIFFLKCQGGWRETTGIVFEEAKPDEFNTSRLVELLESRFKKLASAKENKAASGTEHS
jgi:hypothetical protein